MAKKTKKAARKAVKKPAKKAAGGKKAPAGKPAPRPAGQPPIPPDQRAIEHYRNPRQQPREESVKPQRPAPGRFHPGRGDLGGRG